MTQSNEAGPSNDASDLSLARFWAPRYWPTWLLLGVMRVLARLPYRWQLATGRRLGRLLKRVKRRERSTAHRNLEICFPELTSAERAELLNRHFEAVGTSFVEMAAAWFVPIDRLLERFTVVGREHLDRALAAGKGVLLVSAHFTTLELCFIVLEVLVPHISCMYRPQRNAMMDVVIRRGRRRFEQIPRDNVRQLLRILRSNSAVAYLPDQTHLGKHSALLPFFGEPAVTNIATSRLAELSGAAVLTFFFRRLPALGGYRIDIGPPIPGIPSADALADTRALVARLEAYIRLAPEQYLWLYKKFKGRPAPYPDVYAPDERRAAELEVKLD